VFYAQLAADLTRSFRSNIFMKRAGKLDTIRAVEAQHG
jgi:hypothetical protein